MKKQHWVAKIQQRRQFEWPVDEKTKMNDIAQGTMMTKSYAIITDTAVAVCYAPTWQKCCQIGVARYYNEGEGQRMSPGTPPMRPWVPVDPATITFSKCYGHNRIMNMENEDAIDDTFEDDGKSNSRTASSRNRLPFLQSKLISVTTPMISREVGAEHIEAAVAMKMTYTVVYTIFSTALAGRNNIGGIYTSRSPLRSKYPSISSLCTDHG